MQNISKGVDKQREQKLNVASKEVWQVVEYIRKQLMQGKPVEEDKVIKIT